MRCAPTRDKGNNVNQPLAIHHRRNLRRNQQLEGLRSARTSLARAREQHRLEPRREVVHHSKVARRDEEVADSHQDRDALLQEERREDRLRRDAQLDVHEQQRERHRAREWGVHRRGGPLRPGPDRRRQKERLLLCKDVYDAYRVLLAEARAEEDEEGQDLPRDVRHIHICVCEGDGRTVASRVALPA